MNNYLGIIEVISACLEVGIMIIFFNGIFKLKEETFVRRVLIILGSMIIFSIFSFMKLPSYLNMLSTVIICVILLTLYIGTITKKVYVVLLFLLFILGSDSMTSIILAFMFQDSYSLMPDETITRVLGIMMTDFLIFGATIYTSKIFNKKIRNLTLKYWLLVVLCPIFSFIILQILDILLVNTKTTNLFFALIPNLTLIYINFAIFDFFETYSNQLKLKVMEELMTKNQENYKILETTESEIRILKHDIKNHVLIMENLILSNDTETVREHLESLKATVNKISYVVYTVNAALDSVLNIEGRKAQAENIDYTVKICLANDICIDPADICTIFSNALDNAIEGCKNSAEKYVNTSLNAENGFIKISIENSADDVKIQSNNMLTSTKEDKFNHGYGIKSIQNTIRKYNGKYSMNFANKTFVLNILLENKKSSL